MFKNFLTRPLFRKVSSQPAGKIILEYVAFLIYLILDISLFPEKPAPGSQEIQTTKQPFLQIIYECKRLKFGKCEMGKKNLPEN